MMKIKNVQGIICLVILFLFANQAWADELDTKKKALEIISDHANRICYSVPLHGGSNKVEISGEAKAELTGVAKKLADLGLKGAAKYESAEYQGVLQSDLAKTLRNSSDCKKDVYRMLIDRLMPAQNKKKASQNSRATNPPTDKNTNTPSYEVKKIIELTDKFDVDSISKIIERTKNDENNKDVYWFTRAIYSIMQPVSSTDDPINCINKIDKDSKFYRYSISIAREYLQANSSCESTPNKALINFANSMKEKGDISPLVDLTYYIESTIEKTDYGIGDERRFPFHENTQYKLCLQHSNYYVEAYTNIRHKFENKNFKITYNGAHSINTGLNKQIRIDAIYLFLPQLIGALHGSASLAFSIQGDKINAQNEMKEFLKYFPHGITDGEKNSFRIIYGSIYLYLLDEMFKQKNVQYK